MPRTHPMKIIAGACMALAIWALCTGSRADDFERSQPLATNAVFTQTEGNSITCDGAGSVFTGEPLTVFVAKQTCVHGGEVGIIQNSDAFVADLPATVLRQELVWGGKSENVAGDWTVRFNLSAFVTGTTTWDEVHIGVLNSSCAHVVTLGSNLAVGQTMDSTGVKTATISTAGRVMQAGERIQIQYVFDAAGAGDIWGIVPDQNIDTTLILSIEQPGHEFTQGPDVAEFTMKADKPHFDFEDQRLHYTMPPEN